MANHPHTNARTHRSAWCMMLIVLTVLITCLVPLHATPAWADDNTSDTDTSTGVDTTQQSTATGLTVTIDSMTPVITPTSGFHTKLTVTNNGEFPIEHVRVRVQTNLTYHFVARTDMQQWADGTSPIPTNDELFTLSVGTVQPGSHVTVAGDLNADASQLQALTAWGPRPLAISLIGADDQFIPEQSTLHTFMTRSQDGIAGERTPALAMTVVMPLTAHNWQSNTNNSTQIITSGLKTNNPNNVATLPDATVQELRAKDELVKQYPKLQEVTDPLMFSALGSTHAHALMQAGALDIATFSHINEPMMYTRAGITEASWSAQAGVDQWHSTLGDTNARTTSIAWQGANRWTMSALNTARAQGYDTVIATDDGVDENSATAQTQVYHVQTDAGQVTVLGAQSTLSSLASEQATSDQASAETSQAGRIQRFVAQSAFYQMEQPYTSRILLVCANDTASAASLRAMMAAIEQSTWLSLTDLNVLANAQSTIEDASMPALIDDTATTNEDVIQSTRTSLDALAQSRSELARFNASILATDEQVKAAQEQSVSESSPSASTQPEQNQDQMTSTQWGESLLQAHDAYAARAPGGNTAQQQKIVNAAAAFNQQLLDRITLVPSGNLNVLSETASMPVTVSNKLPYPIYVRVSSRTDSMEIVTSRLRDVEVGPFSETQTSFVVRVSTAGTAVAREQLLDRDNQAFGAVQQTSITSSLQISDKSGFVIIVIALVLGLLGLWRQFHRKKDPDE